MKNWTIKEAVKTINEGTDQAGITELAKHFPMFFMAVAKNDLAGLANAMGDKFTVRRLEFGGTTDSDGETDSDAETATTAAADVSGKDLNAMSTKELMKLCDARGIKIPHYGKNKQFYLDMLNGAGATTAAAAEDDGAEEDTDPYAGKTAMELFKECKKRGIKAEPKKPAKHYISLLKKADAAAAAEAKDEADDDSWDDDETEEAAPKAETKAKSGGKKSGGKSTKKSAAPAEADDGDASGDDDDDWTI